MKSGTLEQIPISYSEPMDILPFRHQLKDFLTLSLERCMQAVSARSGSIFLIESNKKELVLEVVKGVDRENLEGIRAKIGERIVGKVALEKKALLVEDIDQEPSLKFRPKLKEYRDKSFISVPLEFTDELIGVVNVNDKANGASFDSRDLHTVSTICKYLGITLHSFLIYLEDQKKLNDELSKELGKLRKSQDQHKKLSSLGKFVGGVVHELNNPLDGVIRYINLTLDSMEENGVSREYLLEAKKGLSRITQFVRSLLDFSWGLSSVGREIDMNKAIEECLFQFEHKFKPCKIEVNKFLSPKAIKIADYGLKVVFNNIIKNAIEAMIEGGKLAIITKLEGEFIEIIFTDSGKGMSNEVVDKIFDPFFTTKAMGEGSGLGLAISKEIIERYQGRIAVESEAGKGATFKITLPTKEQSVQVKLEP
ncbi:MAG: GAF domain-containing protein [Candidatus Omnitrophica bacterium]|jgi:signal transduction histidine kinase|nr:GAF domain-containing protein [Candidatus Omnitrophota bacterium]